MRHVPRPDRRAARRGPVELLRHRAAGLREGPLAPRHRHPRPQVQREHRAPQHHPLPVVESRGRRSRRAASSPQRHRRAAAGVDRRHQEPRRARRERVDHRQPERGAVQVQHVDAQAQARRRRRLRAPDATTARRSRSRRARTRRSPTRTPSPPASSRRRTARGSSRTPRRSAPTSSTTSRSCRGSSSSRARASTTSTPTSRTSTPTAPLASKFSRDGPVLVAPRGARRAAHDRADVLLRLGPVLQPVRRDAQLDQRSPTRARTPRRPTRTSWAARSASSTTRSA